VKHAPKAFRLSAQVARFQSVRMQSDPGPKHWFQIVGIDFGWEHPFAATRNAWDKDNDVWYVVASYCEAKATPPIHVAAIKPRGELDTLRMAA
jgi:hypothetical protein